MKLLLAINEHVCIVLTAGPTVDVRCSKQLPCLEIFPDLVDAEMGWYQHYTILTLPPVKRVIS